ncbi:unnamed protein product [Cylindrotheca closterium]|uniref:Uncharacterized protein n=1 Tax=Cylindrotheca closterium TaxID=2856 RepID=A0AAD2JHV4_9STRA|nr:unnamed protein product [Cylindrotheca closterium]
MASVYGACSFPHGPTSVCGLMVASLAAMAASMWGISSCRMAFVEYTNDRGDFSDFYLDPTSDGEGVPMRTGIGLFQWLEPFDDNDWSQGQCRGYTTLQLEFFGDNALEVARGCGVLAVIGAVAMSFWILFLNCVAMGQMQIRVLQLCLVCLTINIGGTFSIFFSPLCQDLVSYQDESYETKCTLDQGGLVVVSAALLWAVALLISCIYIKAPEKDIQILADGKEINAFEHRQERRRQARLQKAQEQKLKQLLAEQKAQQDMIRQKHGVGGGSQYRGGGGRGDGGSSYASNRGGAMSV